MAVDRHTRRRFLRCAVLGVGEGDGDDPPGDSPEGDPPPRAVRGTLVDVGPDLLVVQTAAGEERFVLAPATVVWRGGPVDVGALRRGDDVVVRRHVTGRWVADRVWAQISRVTGTIVERRDEVIEVDCGHVLGRRTLVIPYRASGRIQVRHPQLHPGYLIDVIGLRGDGVVYGLLPATSQPPYRADMVPAPPLTRGPVPRSYSGTATWYDDAGTAAVAYGVAYPALDPGGDCGPSCNAAASCAGLPYLSLGSVLRVRNDCAARSATLPVVGCGAVASRYCDRCVKCGTSPRGRVVDLTMAAFVELGGTLDSGCFNATITVG